MNHPHPHQQRSRLSPLAELPADPVCGMSVGSLNARAEPWPMKGSHYFLFGWLPSASSRPTPKVPISPSRSGHVACAQRPLQGGSIYTSPDAPTDPLARARLARYAVMALEPEAPNEEEIPELRKRDRPPAWWTLPLNRFATFC